MSVDKGFGLGCGLSLGCLCSVLLLLGFLVAGFAYLKVSVEEEQARQRRAVPVSVKKKESRP